MGFSFQCQQRLNCFRGWLQHCLWIVHRGSSQCRVMGSDKSQISLWILLASSQRIETFSPFSYQQLHFVTWSRIQSWILSSCTLTEMDVWDCQFVGCHKPSSPVKILLSWWGAELKDDQKIQDRHSPLLPNRWARMTKKKWLNKLNISK